MVRDDGASMPLLNGGVGDLSKLGLHRLLLNEGSCYDIGLAMLVALTAFFSIALHPIPIAPWLFFFAMIFFGRTTVWTAWQGGLAIFLGWGMAMLSYISVYKLMIPVTLFYVFCLTMGVLVDRVAFHRLVKWMNRVFQSTSNQKHKGLRLFLCLRATVSLLFFPLFYAGFYHAANFFPSPLHIAGCSEVAYTEMKYDIRMLAAVGGKPLISFTIGLFATVAVSFLLTYRVQERGMVEWLRHREAVDYTARRLDDGLMLGVAGSMESSRHFSAESTGSATATLGPPRSYNTIKRADSSPTVRLDMKVPYRRIGSLLRRALIPAGWLLALLVLAGPVIQGLFDGRFFWAKMQDLSDGITTVRMGCLPNGVTEEAVRDAAQQGAQLVMTSEGREVGPKDAAKLSKKYGLAIGVGYYQKNSDGRMRNMFTLVDKNGNMRLNHEKFNMVPHMEDLVPVHPNVSIADFAFGHDEDSTSSATVTNSTVGSTLPNTEALAEDANISDAEDLEQKGEIVALGNDEQSRPAAMNSSFPMNQTEEPSKHEAVGSGVPTGREEDAQLEISEELQHSSRPVVSRLGAAICFDMYSAVDISQAGRQSVDLMLAPSQIWDTQHTAHNSVLRMRAIENGFMLFTCTYDGISGVYGPFGETYSQSYNTKGLSLFDVPVTPQRHALRFFRQYPKISSRIGGFFFLGSIVCGFLGLVFPT